MSPTPDVYAFLKAVLAAIDLPHPATEGDVPAFHAALDDRVLDAVVALKGVLGERSPGADCLGWETVYLRKQLAMKSPTYRRYRASGGGEQA